MRNSVQHFKNVTKIELSSVVKIDITEDLIEFTIAEVGLADIVGSLQFFHTD